MWPFGNIFDIYGLPHSSKNPDGGNGDPCDCWANYLGGGEIRLTNKPWIGDQNRCDYEYYEEMPIPDKLFKSRVQFGTEIGCF